MREMDQLTDLLFPKEGPRTEDLKFFEGEHPVKIEDFCAEAHAVFVQVNSGRSAPSAGLPEDLERLSVTRFLASGS